MHSIKSAWDIPRWDTDYGYAKMPKSAIYAWASHQANLSEDFLAGDIHKASENPELRERKQLMVDRVRQALVERSSFDNDTIAKRMAEVSRHLEDPGLLENFEFFDIPSSDFMLQFYFAVWDRRIAELMGYLHNYGKDLKGVSRFVPEDDVWYQMSYFEGMNINERKKSQNVVDFIRQHEIKKATSFGGGNIPERLYSLMDDQEFVLTVFDDGPVTPLEELFEDVGARERVHYHRESLAKAPEHTDLSSTQDLVWMHGVSMYLNEEDRHEMTGAILAAIALLKPGGYMKYDYLLWTESMRRVISTQNWPYDPRNPMVIFKDPAEAIAQGRKTLAKVNTKLDGAFHVYALDPEITLVEPWGVTSVRFTIQKNF